MAPEPISHPSHDASRPRNSTLAIVSLVLACPGMCFPPLAIAGMICGIVAIKRTGPGKRGGRGLAIAGTTLGGVGLVVSCVLLAIFLPRAHETASRAHCARTLRALGQAMMLYASESGGQYPPDFVTLMTTQDISATVFICPSSNDTPSPTLGRGSLSYIYYGKGATTASVGPDFVLAIEPLGNHDHDGSNVLFGDGRVEFLLRQEIEAIQPDLDKGVNPPTLYLTPAGSTNR